MNNHMVCATCTQLVHVTQAHIKHTLRSVVDGECRHVFHQSCEDCDCPDTAFCSLIPLLPTAGCGVCGQDHDPLRLVCRTCSQQVADRIAAIACSDHMPLELYPAIYNNVQSLLRERPDDRMRFHQLWHLPTVPSTILGPSKLWPMIATDILDILKLDERVIFFTSEQYVLSVQSVEGGLVSMMKEDVLKTNEVDVLSWLEPHAHRLPAGTATAVCQYLANTTLPGLQYISSSHLLRRADPDHLSTHALRSSYLMAEHAGPVHHRVAGVTRVASPLIGSSL